MTKHYCDRCEKLITKANTCIGGVTVGSRLGGTVEGNGHRLTVEVITSHDDVANAGEFCKHCVLDALYELDDRPKAVKK
jgi:hypothetical protein